MVRETQTQAGSKGAKSVFKPHLKRLGAHLEPSRSVLVLMPHAVAGEAFTLWCRHHLGCAQVDWATSFERGREICLTMRPDLLVVDPAIHELAAVKGLAYLRDGLANHLLLLEDRPNDATLTAILQEARASYVSRMATSHFLATSMKSMLVTGRRAFDPVFAKRLVKAPRGFQLDCTGARSLSALTDRERQVMRLLAEGSSVKQCSAMLEIAESTVENHKARLMKKLGVHKSSELALRAVRDGLISL